MTSSNIGILLQACATTFHGILNFRWIQHVLENVDRYVMILHDGWENTTRYLASLLDLRPDKGENGPRIHRPSKSNEQSAPCRRIRLF